MKKKSIEENKDIVIKDIEVSCEHAIIYKNIYIANKIIDSLIGEKSDKEFILYCKMCVMFFLGEMQGKRDVRKRKHNKKNK